MVGVEMGKNDMIYVGGGDSEHRQRIRHMANVCVGRPVHSEPGIDDCPMCPVVEQIAAERVGHGAVGVQVPPLVRQSFGGRPYEVIERVPIRLTVADSVQGR